MKQKNEIVTIDLKAVILAKEGGDITLSLEAKNELEKILQAKRLIDEVYEYVQNRLSDEMAKQNLKKVVAGNIVVTKRFFGTRYKIDKVDEVDERFIEESVSVKPNVKEIDKYLEETGEMPRFISLRERVEKATIQERTKDE